MTLVFIFEQIDNPTILPQKAKSLFFKKLFPSSWWAKIYEQKSEIFFFKNLTRVWRLEY
jgi:hypothetical protein